MTDLCACGCGRPRTPHRAGYYQACYQRWTRANRPSSGPPVPMTGAERAARRSQVRRALEAVDTYELEWQASMPQRRIRWEAPRAAALVRTVGASDAAGTDVVLRKVSDWQALAILLAECADPARTAAVMESVMGEPLRKAGAA